MSSTRNFQVNPNANIHEITQAAAQALSAQGYQCLPQPMGPQSAMLTVSKDRDGIQNFIGLGVECRVTLTLNGQMLAVTIDSEWSNKIIAMAVGWFICLIPFITGIVGAVNQNSLPDKIFTAINMAAMSGGNPAGGYYQAPPQY